MPENTDSESIAVLLEDQRQIQIRQLRKGWWSLHRGKQVVTAAILSRILVFIIAQISTIIVEDYDSSFDTLFSHEESFTPLQKIIKALVKVYMRWDSFYYVHIAQYGYVYEQEHAFFPMFPLLVNFVANIALRPFHNALGEQLLIIISGIIISNISFVGSAVALYRLGIVLFNNESFAYLSAILYCITPANIFMSAIYTESTFALFSFLCMRLLAEKKYPLAALYLGLGSYTRSNCVCYVGFFIWDFFFTDFKWIYSPKLLIQRLSYVTILAMISISGLMAFQAQGYNQFCVKMTPRPGESPWCQNKIPMLYSYVQEHYWAVGWLKYYVLKQSPNFLLAFPMVFLSVSGILTYAKSDMKRFLTANLYNTSQADDLTGIQAENLRTQSNTDTEAAASPSLSKHNRSKLASINEKSSTAGINKFAFLIKTPEADQCFLSNNVLPYVYLWCFLLFMSVTTMHIQVITRFMSSMPTVYWYMAYIILKPKSVSSSGSSKRARFVGGADILLKYVIYYGMVGIVLFSNFFPPA